MKIKFNSDDKLSLNKIIEIPNMTVVVRIIFLENNKYYPQVFLDECLYKLQNKIKMLQFYAILELVFPKGLVFATIGIS